MRKNTEVGKFKESDYQDLALIESIKRGNQHAFSLLFKKYYPYLYRKFYFALRNKEDAEDIASELFQKVYENVHKYKKVYTFNAWISRIAHNYMIDCIRKRKANGVLQNSFSIDTPVSGDDGSSLTFQVPSGDPELMTATESIERMAKLKVIYDVINSFPDKAVDTLPVKTAYIFKKFHYDNKTPVEISSELNMDIFEVEKCIEKSYERYDQGVFERNILKMYLVDDLPYDVIAKKVGVKLNTLKVTLMRAKDKIVNSIDLRKAAIEVSGIYTLEQLNLENIYKMFEGDAVGDQVPNLI